MSYPVLDQDSYQSMCSDWVTYAGELLKQHGYLESDPTGTYDEAMSAAVASFQSANGISIEENQIGPETWSALGVQDTTAESSDGGYSAYAGDGGYGGYGEQSTDSYGYSDPGTDGYADQSYDTSGGADYQLASYPYHDEDTIHDSSGGGSSVPVEAGLEVMAGGKRYIIFTDEVRSGGTISWRARNPGNIRSGDKYGAYSGKKANTASAGSFAVFPDEATGFEAIKQVLRGYGHITVAKAMGKYAPAGDGANDPDAYAKSVAKEMGVSVDTYVDALDDSQMEIFATAIKRVEGWKEGTTQSLDDESLPAEVKKAIRGS